MTASDWHIPEELNPKPEDYPFSISRVFDAVVGLHCYVPPDAFTAHTLGMERTGSGVVIDEAGLIVTIGYLVTEAETIWIRTRDHRVVPGHALAVDQETGFGLVQALGDLRLPSLVPGAQNALQVGDECILAAGGGVRNAVATRLAARHEFAGYWEYALDDAFFTVPAHPFWGGAGLICRDGRLHGIGSLVLQQGGRRRSPIDMNMVVPIAPLQDILPDLLSHGRANRPTRPWLGLYAAEDGDSVLVAGVADGGPAEQAGIDIGDRILAVGDTAVTSLMVLWRSIWACGHAGVTVRLKVLREDELMEVDVISADRTTLLKAPAMH